MILFIVVFAYMEVKHLLSLPLNASGDLWLVGYNTSPTLEEAL